jgi:hypothetical protein
MMEELGEEEGVVEVMLGGKEGDMTQRQQG